MILTIVDNRHNFSTTGGRKTTIELIYLSRITGQIINSFARLSQICYIHRIAVRWEIFKISQYTISGCRIICHGMIKFLHIFMATHQHYLSNIFPTFAIKFQNRSERQTIGNDNDNENYIKYPQLTQIDTFKMEYV